MALCDNAVRWQPRAGDTESVLPQIVNVARKTDRNTTVLHCSDKVHSDARKGPSDATQHDQEQ
jgi:hypothetical protein